MPLFGGGASSIERGALNARQYTTPAATRDPYSASVPDAIYPFTCADVRRRGPSLADCDSLQASGGAESRRHEIGAWSAELTTQVNNKAAVTGSRPLTWSASFDIRRGGNPLLDAPDIIT